MSLLTFKLKKRIGMLVREIKVLDLVKENQTLKQDQQYLLEEIDDQCFAKQKLNYVIRDLESILRGETACNYCRKYKSCSHSKFMVNVCLDFDYIRKPLEGLPDEEE